MTRTHRVGVLTTDADLIVLSADDWCTRALSLGPGTIIGRPLSEVIPGVAGGAVLDRLRETLATGVVHVLSPTLHGPLFHCPPTAPSRRFDAMQQRVTVGPLLDGEQVAGLIITIQDVTAELDAERDLAEALASGNDDRRHQAVDAIAESARAGHGLAPSLDSEDWRVRRAAVDRLAAGADQELLRAVLATLRREHRSFGMLSSALKLLAVADVDLTAPLAEMLKTGDVDLRIQAALALGQQQHPAAIAPLLDALDDPDANVRFHAIEALGRLRAEAASDRLAAIAEAGDPFLAFAALDALSLTGDARVGARLVPLLAVDSLRDAAARALSELGDERAVAPLIQALNASPNAGTAVIAAVDAIAVRLANEGIPVDGTVRDTLSPSGHAHVLALVRDGQTADAAAVRLLGWMGGDETLAALGELMRNPAVSAAAVESLVRHGERAVPALIDALGAEEYEVRAAAIGALGRIGSRRATEPLVRILDDVPTAVAVCGALARIGDPAAFEALLARAGHPETAVRLAVVGALNSIGHPEMPARIAGLFESSDPLMRESAVRIAGYFGYRASIGAVLARATDPDERVRSAVIEHLPLLDDARVVPMLETALAGGTPKVRAAAARALARIEPASAMPLLLGAMVDADQWVRYFAARSLGLLRDPAAAAALLSAAEADASQPVRVAALEAIGSLGTAVALEPLIRCASEENVDVAAAALHAIGTIGGAEATAVLQTAARADDPHRRRAAVHALSAAAGEDAVRTLEWLAAADAEPSVADAAFAALAGIASGSSAAAAAAVDSLVSQLADAERAGAALQALAHLPPLRLAELAAGLRHRNPSVRRRVVDALARHHSREATRLLAAAFDDDDSRVREAAAVAVARLGTRAHDTVLGRLAASDPSKSVRRAASDALGATRRSN
jgi:HEAT repeat protein